MLAGRDQDVARLAAGLAQPGMSVICGPAGIGKTALALAAVSASGRRAVVGGGLRTVAHLPGLALSRALAARLPAHDPVLAAEVARARVADGVLVVDDAQWADRFSLAVATRLA